MLVGGYDPQPCGRVGRLAPDTFATSLSSRRSWRGDRHRTTYDPFRDEYTYVWKTIKAWSGQCRKLTVGLDDYTTHTADFKLK